ncbi:hypothetical protein GCM10008942_21950 [Rhizomicrobium electricum]|uniref:Uncharacterized protein n=1 Tax=Rhizomicrobium electricum TaxID=480070 RepID=A0ABN1ERV8_9PROT
MSETLITGLELLALALALVCLIAFNMKAGDASPRAFVSAKRRTNPFGFWLIQTILGAFVVGLLFAAYSALTGGSP